MSSLETVTVLFTDLVGSTGLATRVGPGAAEELRRDYFAILREAVEATGGREVKNVGDGLMVAFGSCSNAVACGVEMQQRIERRNRREDEQFAVRIGISTGEADVEDGDYFGPPVVEAARLCDAAAGDQVLCGDLVRAMARGNDFRPVGSLELKGLAEPYPAYEVVWQPASGGALPLPARLRDVPPVGYVGRRAEREALSFMLEQAREGSRRVAFVSGEPGIGKTRIATQLAVQAHGDGAAVLYGRCDPDLGVPYGPWVRALGHYVAEGPEEVLRAHAGRQGGDLARLVPEVRTRIADYPEPRQTDPEAERYLLFGAVAGLIEEATRETPLVLILDDLHWADAPTVALLRHLATHDGRMRLLLLCTYRDSEIGRDHPLAALLADLHREEGISRIPLTGLDEQSVVALMEAAAGHELEEEGRRLADRIVRETDGNPFFVAEILRHLVETGMLVQGPDGRFRLEGTIEELGLPQSVREVVGRRVERLSEPSRRALGVAAVIGRDFDVGLLARVLETDEDALLDLLDEATAASVVDEASEIGRFTFAHALVNHTLYEDLGRTRRARLHGRIAAALEEICGEDPGARVAELAHHWGHAVTAEEPAKAVDYARRAGERALAELAPDEALRWFSQAIELRSAAGAGDPAELCDLLTGLGEAKRQLGDAAHRETLLEASRIAGELGDAERAWRAAVANHRGFNSVFGTVDHERLAALERAVELVGLGNPARAARLISRQAVELQWDRDHEKRWALADEALALAREAGDTRTLANVVFENAYASAARYPVATFRSLIDECLALGERLDDPWLLVRVGLLDVYAHACAGDVAAADRSCERISAIAADVGQPELRWFGTYGAAPLRFMNGDLAGAERIAEEALQLGTAAGQADAFMIYGATLSRVRAAQDRSDEVVEAVEQAVAANPLMPAWRAALALHYTELGRTAEAGAIVAEVAANGFADIPYDQTRPTNLVMLAAVAFDGEQAAAARPLAALLEQYSDAMVWDGATAFPHVRMYLGMLAALLGEDDVADDHLRFAHDFHERGGMQIFVAEARLRHAQVLARRGDADAARALAERALPPARATGYAYVERLAGELLESAAGVER